MPARFQVLSFWKLRPSVAHFVALEIAAVEADQMVGAGLECIGAEDAGIAVEVAILAGQAKGQVLGRLPLDLAAKGDVVIAFQVVVARLGDIVDPVVAMLPQARQANREFVARPGTPTAPSALIVP